MINLPLIDGTSTLLEDRFFIPSKFSLTQSVIFSAGLFGEGSGLLEFNLKSGHCLHA